MNSAVVLGIVVTFQIVALVILGLLVGRLSSSIVLLQEKFLERRPESDKLLLLLEQISSRVTVGGDTSLRIEAAATSAAEAASSVADDLAASHIRADAIDGPHGAAADASSRSAPNGNGQ